MKFAAKRQIYPDWFIQGGESDWVGLQRAGDSCTTTCTLLLHRIFYLSRVGGVVAARGPGWDGVH